MEENQIISTKQATDFSISYRGERINLVAFVGPIHVNNEEGTKRTLVGVQRLYLKLLP